MEEIVQYSGDPAPCGIRTFSYPETSNAGHSYSAWNFINGNRAGAAQRLTRREDDEHYHPHHSNVRHPDCKGGQGTHTTSFHRGFSRRQESSIKADLPRQSHILALAERAAAQEDLRRARLGDLNMFNHFNVISGAFKAEHIKRPMQSLPGTHSYDACFISSSASTAMHHHMHTRAGVDDPGEGSFPETNGERPVVYREFKGSRLPPNVAKSGRFALAQSHSRFFRPIPSGDKHDRRQDLLVKAGGGASDPRAAGGGNGKDRKRVSGIIGTYRLQDELPSHGIEDCFSKSGYVNAAQRSKFIFGENGYKSSAEPFDYNNKSSLSDTTPGGGLFEGRTATEGMDFAATAPSRSQQLLRRSGALHDGDMRGPDPNVALPPSARELREGPSPYFGLYETSQPGLYTPRKMAARGGSQRSIDQNLPQQIARLPLGSLRSRSRPAESARQEREGEIAVVRALEAY